MLNAEDLDSEKLANINKQLEQYKELKKIRLDPETKNKTKATLSASLRDKAVAEEREFQHRGEKSSGMSSGYVATETETGQTFLLKQFFKQQSDCGKEGGESSQDRTNRSDGVRELIGATMYQFLLYDHAPKEQLVTGKDKKSLYVRSKFFEDVEQLETALAPLNQNAKAQDKIEGFEKVIAACHILGDSDYHARNIMVTKDHKATKIDHGKSFMVWHADFASMIVATNDKFKRRGYYHAIANGNLTFDIEKYSAALNQMVTQLSEAQINAIVDQRIAELKKEGFNPQGLYAARALDAEGSIQAKRIEDTDPVKGWNNLSGVYKEIITDNLKKMKDIAKQVEIVAKFSNVTPEFKKGGWLKAFAESNEKDPIKFAIYHKIKIDGRNAPQK